MAPPPPPPLPPPPPAPPEPPSAPPVPPVLFPLAPLVPAVPADLPPPAPPVVLPPRAGPAPPLPLADWPPIAAPPMPAVAPPSAFMALPAPELLWFAASPPMSAFSVPPWSLPALPPSDDRPVASGAVYVAHAAMSKELQTNATPVARLTSRNAVSCAPSLDLIELRRRINLQLNTQPHHLASTSAIFRRGSPTRAHSHSLRPCRAGRSSPATNAHS